MIRPAFQIIRGGRSREIFMQAPTVALEGWCTAELIHARTGLIKQRLQFRNLIMDAALDVLGTGGATHLNAFAQGWIGVGTGSTAPAANQTGLVAEIGTRSNSNGGIADVTGSGAAFAYWYYRMTRIFLEANANGNLTEFGVFNLSTASTMFARQLFKDGTGTPTTIVKTSAEQLRITYEVRIYPPTADQVGGPISIGGTNYNYTSRAANIGTATAWGSGGATGMLVNFGSSSGAYANAMNSTAIGTTSQAGPTGSTASATADTITMTSYVAGSFYREWTYIWSAGIANFTGGSGGVSGFAFAPHGSANSLTHQAQLSAAIPKDNTKRLTLVWRFPFGRYP
jgi:hypothetical protein